MYIKDKYNMTKNENIFLAKVSVYFFVRWLTWKIILDQISWHWPVGKMAKRQDIKLC